MTAQSAGLEQRARELLAKWRAGIAAAPALDKGLGTSRFADIAAGMAQCADELEAALAAPAADGVLVPREIVENYAQSTLIPRHKRICEAALAALPHMQPACPKCGAGVLFECVACSASNYPEQPAGEAVACKRARIVGWWNCDCAECREYAKQNTLTTPPQPSAGPQQEAPGAVAWSPIESAPKDGTQVPDPPNKSGANAYWLDPLLKRRSEALTKIWAGVPLCEVEAIRNAATQPAPVDVRRLLDHLGELRCYYVESRDGVKGYERREQQFTDLIAEVDADIALLSAQQFIDTQRKSPQVRQKIIAYQYHNTLTFAEEADDFMQNEGTALVSALDAQQPSADARDDAIAAQREAGEG